MCGLVAQAESIGGRAHGGEISRFRGVECIEIGERRIEARLIVGQFGERVRKGGLSVGKEEVPMAE